MTSAATQAILAARTLQRAAEVTDG
jgi:hypothetical protein